MHNLKITLSFLFFLAVALPVLLITSISAVILEDDSRKKIHQRLNSEVSHLERQINFSFEQVDSLVNFLSDSDEVIARIGNLKRFDDKTDNSLETLIAERLTEESVYKLFTRIGNSMKDIAYVYMGDNNKGYKQWPVGALTDNYDPTIRPWFLAGRNAQGRLARPPAYYWAGDNSVQLSTVKYIPKSDGSYGVLGIDITLTKMDAIIREMSLGLNERLLLIESTGTVLTDTLNTQNQFKAVGKVLPQKILTQLNKLNHTQASLIEIENQSFWVAKYDFKKMGWTFYVLIPESSLTTQIKKMHEFTVPLAVLCILIFSLLALLIARKITSLIKIRENQLVDAKEEAEAAVIAKSLFLANMNHEIRTPLNGVLGMTQLLSTTDLSNEQKEKVDTILLSGNRLMNLINEVLDLSKAEANELELSPHLINLEESIGNIAKSFQANVSKQGLDLILDLYGLDNAWAEVDDLRLGQVIGNLLSNAIKFTESGHIEIKAAIEEDKTALLIEVTDSGIGLNPEQQQVIFDKFKQADNTTTRKYGGTGLGLSLSSTLVELMGGKLQVRSELGQGATFWFAIPISVTNHSEGESPQNTEKWQGLNVLILDDIQSNNDVLSAILSNLSANISCFTEPKSALAALNGGEVFDMVIVDYLMPEMDGLSWIQAAKLPAHCCRVLLTSVDDTKILEQVVPHFDKVLHKPMFQRDIVDLINLTIKEDSSTIVEKSLDKAPEKTEIQTQLNGNILIVEDNRINFMILKSYLTKQGIDFDWADDGGKAITKFLEGKYDLILMDCMLPDVDGYEATTGIRASDKADAKTIPIIALTADSSRKNEERCYSVGMNDYLTKPVDLEALHKKLQSYL